VAILDNKEYLIGCDPELFVWDTQTERYIGAQGIVPGTKSDPYLLDGGMVQVDGLALEFGIDPAVDEQDFVDKIAKVRATIQAMIGSRYQMHAVPHVVFDQEVMDEQLPENLELGCEPDFNAWTLQVNQSPNAATTMRSGGGHLHIGYGSRLMEQEDIHFRHCAALVRQLDATVGLGTTTWDKDTVRRSLYGNPGAFRPKNYGLEYRTPSNAWLASEKYTRLAYRLTMYAIQKLHQKEFLADNNSRVCSNIVEGRDWRATRMLYEVNGLQSKKEGYYAI
jgi:hypothetical protein